VVISKMEKMIKKIEFYEKKSRNLIMPYIETQFFVSDIAEFLKWCAGEEWNSFTEYDFYSNLARVSKWKKREKKFEMHFKGRVIIVYPDKNVVAVFECGLHYVCQHSFDILPREVRDRIYGYEEFILGKLYPLSRHGATIEPLDVKNTDISTGFLLHREQINAYNDSFVDWIYYRRRGEANASRGLSS